MADIILNKTERWLLDQLLEMPPKFNEAKAFLNETALQPDSITKVAIGYAEQCFLDVDQAPSVKADTSAFAGIIPGLHSTYIYDVVMLLLDYGLNPNAVFGSPHQRHNIMESVLFVDNGYLGADTLVLLLENGGDPNLMLDGQSIFDQVDFDIFFGAIEQEIRWRYDAWVHMWFVLLGYGGTAKENELPVHVFKEYETNEIFDLKKLRNHRDFYYGLSVEEKEATIHIYDKRTFWEVARW